MTTSIQAAIHNTVSEFDTHPYDINDGQCIEFAQTVCQRIPDAEPCCTSYVLNNPRLKYPIHEWVYYQGRHYDAECPDGVDDWQRLPFFKNSTTDIEDDDLLDTKFN